MFCNTEHSFKIPFHDFFQKFLQFRLEVLVEDNPKRLKKFLQKTFFWYTQKFSHDFSSSGELFRKPKTDSFLENLPIFCQNFIQNDLQNQFQSLIWNFYEDFFKNSCEDCSINISIASEVVISIPFPSEIIVLRRFRKTLLVVFSASAAQF